MPNKKLFYGLVGFVILVILGMYMFYGEQKKSDEQESVAMHLGEYIQGIPQSVYSADTALQILESEEFLNFANQGKVSASFGGERNLAQVSGSSCVFKLLSLSAWANTIIELYNDWIGIYGVDEANSKIEGAVLAFISSYNKYYTACLTHAV